MSNNKSSDIKKGKLLSLIEILNLSQRKDLIHFINMPSNKLTTRDREILGYLLDKCKSGSSKTEESTWLEILKREELNNKNRIKNRLLKAIERYTCLYEIELNKPIKNLLLSEFYVRHQIKKNAELIIRKGIRELEKPSSCNLRDKVILFWMYEIAINREKGLRNYDIKIDLMDSALTDFYNSNKIRILCEKTNRHKIIKAHKNATHYLDEVEQLAQRSKSPQVKAYFNVFKLITEEKGVYFENLEKFILEFGDNIKEEYLKEFYLNLMNYCIRRFNSGELIFAEKYIFYVKKLANKNILLDNGLIGIGRFKNIVFASIVISKEDNAEWVLEFIDKYSMNLPKSKFINREFFLALNKAIVELYRGNVDQSFTYILAFQNSDMYLKDIYYKITCDKLLLKIFYLKNETEALLSKVESIKQYLRSHEKLSEVRKDKHLNFIKKIEKLAAGKKITLSKSDNEMLIPDLLWLRENLDKNG